jgi:class 3 adenylate cyclase
MVPRLGWQPASRESFLASALHGRYQMYEQGLAVWEELLSGAGDVAYPVAHWASPQSRARSCTALVAFFDLRKFTEWSAKKDPDEVQGIIESFERGFQNAFSRSWCERLFSKGTGDGLMVVSEAGNFEQAVATQEGELQLGHCKAFCAACAETVEEASRSIPDALAVGGGVTLGKIKQFYFLGRPDYIGPVVNEASKIQAIAYGELCVSTEVVNQLQSDGVNVTGKNIPGKGMRLATTDLANLRG